MSIHFFVFPYKQVCLHCVTFVYSVTEVVWETDGVEEPHETKPASAKTVAQPAVVETKPITDKYASLSLSRSSLTFAHSGLWSYGKQSHEYKKTITELYPPKLGTVGTNQMQSFQYKVWR